MANKDDITDFIKKSDFDTKLTKVNNKVSSNKTEHVEVKNDLTDVSKKFYKHQWNDITFCWAEYTLQAIMVNKII